MAPSPAPNGPGSVPARPKADIVFLSSSQAEPRSPSHLLFRPPGSRDEQAQPWLAIAAMPAFAPLSSFEAVMQALIVHPERNSSTIMRADILQDDVAKDVQDGQEWTRTRTILRRLMPRRPNIDWPMLQACESWSRRRAQSDGGDDDELVFVYTPLATTEEGEAVLTTTSSHLRPVQETDVPFYHPKVRGIAFRYLKQSSPREQADGSHRLGTIRIDICPFDGTLSESSNEATLPTSHRISRTALALLQTIHAHTWGHAHDYVKRVKHDVLIPRNLFQDTYLALKARHAERIMGNEEHGRSALWVEKTDPEKHVFEDISIAAWLMCLWRDMYPPGQVAQSGDGHGNGDQPTWTNWPRPPGGFVDIGCGNGLLVHLLHLEGYTGFGVDLRQRKSWPVWHADALAQGAATSTDLREVSLDLPALVLAARSDEDARLFPPGSFLIGNHADEISPWLPLLAATIEPVQAASSSGFGTRAAFVNIACCPFKLDGSRFNLKHYDYGGRAELGRLLFGEDIEVDKLSAEDEKTMQDAEVALLLGPPLDPPSSKGAQPGTRNTAYLRYLSHLHLAAGWTIEKEALRIPSTKNWALVGRVRVEDDHRSDDGATSPPRRRRRRRREEIQAEIGRLASGAAPGWKARTPEGNSVGACPH